MGFRQIVGAHVLVGLSGVGLAGTQSTAATLESAERTLPIAVTAQPIETALNEFARQSGIHVVIDSAIAGGIQSTPVKGEMKTEEALKALLKSTGLKYRVLDGKTVSIEKVASSPAAVRPTAFNDGSQESGFREKLRLAQVTEEGSVRSDAPEGAAASASLAVEEIVVTAQKRLERLQDVPVPVTAVSAETLLDSNQLRLQDYYTRIPGLSLTPDDLYGAPKLAIRGITTGGFTTPTVGVTIDDIPYGSSTINGGGYQAPDLDPSELTRIEVLRGPQGTLYGASSMGGLLKFVTLDPSTDGVSGRLQGSLSDVRNGEDIGYSVRGSVNVPLGDTWAVRASGFTRRDPGYIDNVSTGQDAINQTDVDGGRVSAMWRPSENFSLKLGALLQDSERDGAPIVYTGLNDLQQNALRGTGWYNKKVEAYSAIAMARLGAVELTSLTGYSLNSFSSSIDFSVAFGIPAPSLADITTQKLSQEVRLSGSLGERIEWLAGGFYTNEHSRNIANIQAADANGVPTASLLLNNIPTTFEEYAGFADLTFHFTERFDVQIGGRESRNEQTYSAHGIGPFAGGESFSPQQRSKDNAFTYLLTPRFRVSPQLMMYARFASGYRPGGINSGAELYGYPSTYGPDRTQNYELGVKGAAFDRAVSFDASIYSIEWRNMQVLVTDPDSLNSYAANASRARSRGAELSMESRPVTGLAIAAWVAWTDAELTRGFPPDSTAAGGVYGVSGNRLPNSARFSGGLSLDQDVPLSSSVTAFVGGSVSYVGERAEVFTSTPERQVLPAYAQTDLRAGVRLDVWTANLFVTNLTDRRGVLSGGLGTTFPFAFNYIQPRVMGLAVARSF